MGPTMVFVVVNERAAPATLTYAYEADGLSGGGEGGVEPCSSTLMTFGEGAGQLNVMVDAETVLQGRVPALRAGTFVVVRLRIDGAGDVTAIGPLPASEAPRRPADPVECVSQE